MSHQPPTISLSISATFIEERTRESDFCGGQGFRHKKLRDRENCSLSLNCCFWPVSVPNLARFVAPFVHFAIRPLL